LKKGYIIFSDQMDNAVMDLNLDISVFQVHFSLNLCIIRCYIVIICMLV